MDRVRPNMWTEQKGGQGSLKHEQCQMVDRVRQKHGQSKRVDSIRQNMD